ncbi:MAG: RluA family pseudouridine synthase [Alphaproteobacteria bacterium]|nr:RluA family pseudouridine synthase [Alphaproteobacteria bacterium]
MSEVQIIKVTEEEGGTRLDRWFRRRFPRLGHGPLEKMVRTGQVRVDGGRVTSGQRLEPGQSVRVPPLPEDANQDVSVAPRRVSERDANDLRDRVLYRDDQVIAIDKPAGLAVQGGTGTARHLDGMLDALRFGAPERPRLVHRLDKDTSGVLLLARTAAAAALLAAAFKGREAHKIYWALVVGVPRKAQGRIRAPLAKLPGHHGERMVVDEDEGVSALTDYRVLDSAGDKVAWLELEPHTGRTHQLRAHCALIGTPILGDGKYGGGSAHLSGADIARKVHLHARTITVPVKGKILRVTAPLPPHMAGSFRFFGFESGK